MLRKAPVSTIMTHHVVCLKKEDNLEDAEYLFKKYHIRHIPVISGTAIIGMLSKTDLLRIGLLDGEDHDDINTLVRTNVAIERVMTKELITVSSSTPVRLVAEILAKEEFHALPVVDNNRLVGIVTTTDLINYLLNQF